MKRSILSEKLPFSQKEGVLDIYKFTSEKQIVVTNLNLYIYDYFLDEFEKIHKFIKPQINSSSYTKLLVNVSSLYTIKDQNIHNYFKIDLFHLTNVLKCSNFPKMSFCLKNQFWVQFKCIFICTNPKDEISFIYFLDLIKFRKFKNNKFNLSELEFAWNCNVKAIKPSSIECVSKFNKNEAGFYKIGITNP